MAAPILPHELAPEVKSPTQMALRRFRKNRLALACLGIFVIVSLSCFILPLFISAGYQHQKETLVAAGAESSEPEGPSMMFLGVPLYHENVQDPARQNEPPSFSSITDPETGRVAGAHFMGTDNLGRDILSRLIYGGRISIAVGFVATIVALLIGVTWGALAGYVGGKLDEFMMRLVDILYSLPYLFFVILLVTLVNAILGANPYAWKRDLNTMEKLTNSMNYVMSPKAPEGGEEKDWVPGEEDGWSAEDQPGFILRGARRARISLGVDPSDLNIIVLFVAIGAVSWLTMSRIVRGQVLSLKQKEFVEAARGMGAGTGRILFRHLVPNTLGPIIVYATLTVPAIMLEEAFLSFLGLGVQPPFASWGTLASEGAAGINAVSIAWWLILFPGLALTITLFSLTFIGDGLRDAFDPRMRS